MNNFKKKLLPLVLGALSVGGNACFNSSAVIEKVDSSTENLVNKLGMDERLVTVQTLEYQGSIDIDKTLGIDTYSPLVEKNPSIVFYHNKNNELVDEYNRRLDMDGKVLDDPHALGVWVGWHVRDKIKPHPLAKYLESGRDLSVVDSDKKGFYNCYTKSNQLLVLNRTSREYELFSEGIEKARENSSYICDFWVDVKTPDSKENQSKSFPWMTFILAETVGVSVTMGAILEGAAIAVGET